MFTYLKVQMIDITKDKADMSREMEVIDGTAKHPWFAFKSDRTNSFRNWKADLKLTPLELAMCGFFNFGQYEYQISLK